MARDDDDEGNAMLTPLACCRTLHPNNRARERVPSWPHRHVHQLGEMAGIRTMYFDFTFVC